MEAGEQLAAMRVGRFNNATVSGSMCDSVENSESLDPFRVDTQTREEHSKPEYSLFPTLRCARVLRVRITWRR